MNQLAAALNLGVGLVLLWVLYYFGWLPYRVDRVRNALFELRNELFLYAVDADLLKNPAYKGVRRRIEALIRYAHMIGLTRLVVFVASGAHNIPRVQEDQEKLKAAIEHLPQEQRDTLTDIQERVYVQILEQVILKSPLVSLFTFGILLPVGAILNFFRREPKEELNLKMAKELRVDLIEEQAVLAQQEEEREMAVA